MAVTSTTKCETFRAELERDASLLAAEDLTIEYRVNSRVLKAVEGVSFSIGARQIVGLLGESGCGKTTTALSALRLLPETSTVTRGGWSFCGRDLLNYEERQLRKLRGAGISIIFQDSHGLNPVMRVGTQVVEVLRAHCDCSLQAARAKVNAIFDSVGLADFDRIFDAYPHQLSGGQCQRVVIAQALVCRPKLVIADEPTAHVDAETAADIFACMKKMRDTDHMSFLIISHDPEMLATIADRILVMYAGQLVEQGPAEEVLSKALHPYTQALLQCSLDHPTVSSCAGKKKRFPFIPGSSSDPFEILPGCCFSPRCPDRMPICDSNRPVLFEHDRSQVRCFKYERD
jgi:oligopeptide/dipeptide ABC transporter ATP-binding protein